MALVASTVTPSLALDVSVPATVGTEYSNPSKMENSNDISDTSNLEYLIVDGANTLKATSNEAATADKPLRIFHAETWRSDI